jgi:hypothetical protein
VTSNNKFPLWIDTVKNNPGKLSVRNGFSKALKTGAQTVFKKCWKIWREQNKQDETLSPNNFFKSRQWNEVLLKKCVPKFRNRIQSDIDLALK